MPGTPADVLPSERAAACAGSAPAAGSALAAPALPPARPWRTLIVLIDCTATALETKGLQQGPFTWRTFCGAGPGLAAPALPQAALLLDRLVASPELRQEASAKLLEIAKYLSVEELAEEYEQGLCSFLSPEALDLRKVTPDEGPLRPER